jgi:hypothetical protein
VFRTDGAVDRHRGVSAPVDVHRRGPHDNAASIRRRLVAAVGDDGFDEIELWGASEIDDDVEAGWDEDESAEDVAALSAS